MGGVRVAAGKGLPSLTALAFYSMADQIEGLLAPPAKVITLGQFLNTSPSDRRCFWPG
jgi:hypothetical protein